MLIRQGPFLREGGMGTFCNIKKAAVHREFQSAFHHNTVYADVKQSRRCAMKRDWLKLFGLFLIISYFLCGSVSLAASSNPGLQKAKQEAEARGFLFATSREEIVAMAKKESKLAVIAGLETATINAMRDAFKAEYPFLDASIVEITGEANKRLLMELKAGRDTGWDSIHMATDDFDNYLSFMKKIDILGMAEQGVLQIPVKVIQPTNRNILTLTSALHVVAYNKKFISPDKVPNTWEGFLKPEFKGRKFLADIRPTEIAALVPAWGLEKTLDFSHRLAAQQPIWIRGASRALISMAAGEYTLLIGPALNTVKRLQANDPTESVDYKIVEPIPVRLSDANGILTTAKHPYAALLWLDFVASPKGQRIADKYEPCAASVFSPGSFLAEVSRGKNLSLVGWDQFAKMREYQEKVVGAYSFPTADSKK